MNSNNCAFCEKKPAFICASCALKFPELKNDAADTGNPPHAPGGGNTAGAAEVSDAQEDTELARREGQGEERSDEAAKPRPLAERSTIEGSTKQSGQELQSTVETQERKQLAVSTCIQEVQTHRIIKTEFEIHEIHTRTNRNEPPDDFEKIEILNSALFQTGLLIDTLKPFFFPNYQPNFETVLLRLKKYIRTEKERIEDKLSSELQAALELECTQELEDPNQGKLFVGGEEYEIGGRK